MNEGNLPITKADVMEWLDRIEKANINEFGFDGDLRVARVISEVKEEVKNWGDVPNGLN